MDVTQDTNAVDELPVEFVCIVSERDLAIVRYMLASLAISSRHFSRPPRVHAFVDHRCVPEFANIIELPLIRQWLDVRVSDKSDYAEVLTGDGFRDQMLLKFFASALVSTPYYWVVDCDYFFLSPLRIAAFMRGTRSTYAVEPWIEGADDTRRWRSATEAVLGKCIPLNGMTDPPYILSVAVVSALLEDHNLLQRFRDTNPPAAELDVYAAFALSSHPDAHHWLTRGDTGRIKLLNQDRIGGFPRLSSLIVPEDFDDCQAVVFWSYWDECESVMRRFLREVFEREGICSVGNESLLAPYYRPTSATELTRYGLGSVHGVYSDGWVHSEIYMQVACDADHFILNLEADWEVAVAVAIEGSPTVENHRIGPGVASGIVVIDLPDGPQPHHSLSLTFTHHKLEVPTGRKLVAREISGALPDSP